MDDVTEITVHELYNSKQDWGSAVVLKELPVDEPVDIEYLDNFLGIIVGDDADVKHICCPVASVPAVIAVFDKTICDVGKYDVKLDKRKFKGQRVIFEKLGLAAGVFLTQVPVSVDEDFITLYFESEKRCGYECEVESVKVARRCAAVTILDETAVSATLAKQGHWMKEKDVVLSPYFPAYHDYIMDRMTEEAEDEEDEEEEEEEEGEKEEYIPGGAVKEENPHVIDEETVSVQVLYERHTRDVPVRPPKPVWQPDRDVPKRPPKPAWQAYSMATAEDTKLHGTDHIDSDISNNASKEDEVEHQRRSPVVNLYNTTETLIVQPKKPAKLMDCIIDGGEDWTSSEKSEAVVHQQPAQLPMSSPIRSTPPKPRTVNRNTAQSPDKFHGNRTADGDTKYVTEESHSETDQKRHRQRKPSGGKRKGKMSECEEVPVNNVSKIFLLKHIKFHVESKQSGRVHVVLDTNLSKVIIRGVSQEAINAEKLRLHERLHNICDCTKKLSVNRFMLFSQREPLCHMRSLCRNEKLQVSLYVCSKQHELICLALTKQDAARGVTLVMEKLQEESVNLRPGQIDQLHGPKWSDFQEQLKGSLGTAYISEDKSKVIVEAFTRQAVEITRQKVDDFLKENVVKVLKKFELNGAEAQCFQKFLQHKLEGTIRERHGIIKVDVVKTDYPMKLTLTVEGDDSIVKNAESCLDKIWHEKFDFKKVSDNDADQWLLMRGLTEKHGRPFFKKFQQDNNCFINVTEEGQVPPPPRDVKKVEVQQPHYSPPPPQQYGHSPERQRRPRSSPLERGFGLSTYQPSDMTEEEALQDAVMKSMQFEGHAFRQHAPQSFEPGRRQTSLGHGLRRSSSDEEDDIRPVAHQNVHNYDEMQPGLDIEPDQYGYGPSRNNIGISQHRYANRPLAPRHRETGRRQYLGQGYGRNSDDQYSITINQTKVELKRGQIAKFNADALVNIVGPALKLDEGTVSKTFLQLGGQQLETEFQSSIQLGPTIRRSRPCGNLPCKTLYHVVLKKGGDCSTIVQQTMTQVLSDCVNQGLHSVAFPPLGVGRMYQYDTSQVARAMLQAIQNLPFRQRLGVVTFVIYDDDDKVFSEFKRRFQKWEENEPSAAPQTPFSRPRSKIPQFAMPTTTGVQNYNDPFQKALSMQRGARAFQQPQRAHQKLRRDPDEVAYSRTPARNMQIPRRQATDYDDTSHATRARDKVSKSRASRFPQDAPVKRLTVVVFAETKDKCIGARDKLGKAVKAEFLFEENMKKLQKLSPNVKVQIIDVISKHMVKSVRGKDGYIIKGHRESVGSAHKEILQLLLDTGGQTESAIQEKRQRRKRVQRATPEYTRFMVQEEPDVPRYWKNFKPGHPIKSALTDIKMAFKGDKYVKETLDSSDQMYIGIINLINSTWDPTTRGQGKDARGLDQLRYTKMQVAKIQRIENLDLYYDYVLKRVKVFTRLFQKGMPRYPEIHSLPGCTGKIKSAELADKCLMKDMNPEVNEFYFFHGTKKQNIEVICNQGFDNRLASGSAMFGPGTYGAETPSKADQYADDQDKRSAGKGHLKYMFLMRMILGNAFVCKDPNPHKFRRPPCTTCQKDDCTKHQGLYDSVVGDNKKLFREFVVYEPVLCYPEYLVTYERL